MKWLWFVDGKLSDEEEFSFWLKIVKFALGQNKHIEYCLLLSANLVITYKTLWGRRRKPSRKRSRRKKQLSYQAHFDPWKELPIGVHTEVDLVWCQVLPRYPRRSQGRTKQHWEPAPKTWASGHTQGSQNLFAVRGSFRSRTCLWKDQGGSVEYLQ